MSEIDKVNTMLLLTSWSNVTLLDGTSFKVGHSKSFTEDGVLMFFHHGALVRAVRTKDIKSVEPMVAPQLLVNEGE